MTDLVQVLLFLLLLIIIPPFLGIYMAWVFQSKPHPLQSALGWLERGIYRLSGVNSKEEMHWKTYTRMMLYFNGLGLIFLFSLQFFQRWLPLNPEQFPAVEWSLAFNTAISFVTNTNWQSYSGETTMSYLTQMLGLTVQNFLSAATGSAVLLAMIRGIKDQTMNTIGNFWVDVTRTVVYLLIPLSLFFSLFLVYEGVIQNFNPYENVITLSQEKQTIPMGPVASQVAIKQLGTNGGGFFGANSAHPFENPTRLSNFFECYAILMIPAAMIFMFGAMIGSQRQAICFFVVVFILWLVGFAIAWYSEGILNASFPINPVFEGKEVRFGSMNSALWTVSSTATSNGSVNSMLSSLSPLTGAVALFNILVGEIIFGGIGVGLLGFLMYVLLTVFIAGLMVGRTPEFLGKKIERYEVQWVMIAIISPSALILIGSTFAIYLPDALHSLGNAGPHGLSELLYAFASAAGNNGSAFASLDANTIFYNLILGVIMLLCRCSILIPSLAIAGSLIKKTKIPLSSGTFITDTPLFGILLFSVILIVAGLVFFPALSLGPIVEHLLMKRGETF